MMALSWRDFEEFIESIQDHFDIPSYITGVFGVLRGGLIPAVTISHYLNLPLLREPCSTMLWVDDIVDSGRTFNKFRESWKDAYYLCWVSRESIDGLNSGIILRSIGREKDWILFPWENDNYAEEDQKTYRLSRHEIPHQ